MDDRLLEILNSLAFQRPGLPEWPAVLALTAARAAARGQFRRFLLGDAGAAPVQVQPLEQELQRLWYIYGRHLPRPSAQPSPAAAAALGSLLETLQSGQAVEDLLAALGVPLAESLHARYAARGILHRLLAGEQGPLLSVFARAATAAERAEAALRRQLPAGKASRLLEVSGEVLQRTVRQAQAIPWAVLQG